MAGRIVHHYNTHLTGGAANAARRLHEALKDRGVTSRFFTFAWEDGNLDDSYRAFGRPLYSNSYAARVMDRLTGRRRRRIEIQQELNRYLQDRPGHFELFSYAKLPDRTVPALSREIPDVIHLHWIPGLLDYPSFFKNIPSGIPVVWSLHDMNPFTGGCHYSWDCSRYVDQCGDCPQLNENRAPDDLSKRNWKMKRDAVCEIPIHLVANSRWIQDCARKSSMFTNAHSIRTIHYGLDLEIFRPVDRRSCRAALSIDQNSPVVCFGAESITNRRKGFKELCDAFQSWNGPLPTVLVFGSTESATALPQQLKARFLGPVNSSQALAEIYSAADAFVIPSLYEALGLTAMEAMACGIPVVGFETGGMMDLIENGKTGYRVPTGDSQALAEKIAWLLHHAEERLRMGSNARIKAEEEFSLETYAGKYMELYEEALQK